MKVFLKYCLLTTFIPFFFFHSAFSQEITVGGKNFTEQLLMAEITTQYLNKNGFSANKKDGMGSTLLRSAQLNGEVDLYWEYTGTSLVTYNKVKERLSPEETYQRVKELDAKQGLVWLKPSKANNTYALVVRQNDKKTDNIQTLSDLAKSYKNKKNLKMALDSEFPRRQDGLIGLQKAYNFKVGRRNIIKMDSGLTYNALKDDKVDIALAFSTDGRIQAFNFRLLKDDQNFFPSFALTPVIRKDTLEKHPKLEGLLNKISAKLSDELMQQLNSEVDVDKISVEKVAAKFITTIK